MTKTALVVDDSRSMRKMVADTLAVNGFEIVECTNGQEALNCASNQPVDFVITDVNMPIMDGISFVANLRQRPDFKYTPIVILTTESERDIKERGRSAGATGWMVKPFHPDQLSQIVGKLVP